MKRQDPAIVFEPEDFTGSGKLRVTAILYASGFFRPGVEEEVIERSGLKPGAVYTCRLATDDEHGTMLVELETAGLLTSEGEHIRWKATFETIVDQLDRALGTVIGGSI